MANVQAHPAIYNATSTTTKKELKQKTGSMAGEYKKITLLNVVFEMDLSLIDDEKVSEKYSSALEREHREADFFIRTMLSAENGLVDLFRTDCGVEFKIQYKPAHEFVAMFEKAVDQIDYLKRYCCK